MFHRFACDINFSQNKTLIMHIELSHKFLSHFRCAETNCSKVYTKFDSYRKHRINKHSLSLLSNDDQEVVFAESTPSFEFPNSLKDSEVFEDSNSSENELDLSFDEGLINKQISFVEKLDSKNNRFSNSLTIFVAKLYKFTDIPRKRSIEILNDVKQLFDNILEQISSEFSNTSSENNEDSFTIHQINNVLHKLSKSFKEVSTVARCFKKFVDKGTLILPKVQ